MITIRMGKQLWEARGHGPKMLCFHVTQLFAMMNVAHADEKNLRTKDGYSRARAPRGQLRTAMFCALHSLAANYPKHVLIDEVES